MIYSRQLPVWCLAGLLLGVAAPLQAREVSSSPTQAQVRWTSHGIPHILAADERGLGYGIGYAYGQDNLCLLANEALTVNGQRSRYFGATARTAEQRDNLTSDLFFTWLNTPEALSAFWAAQNPDMQQRLQGYVAGFNRALDERRRTGLPAACQGAQWLRPITVEDLLKLTRRLLVEGGIGQFAEALAAAKPPTAATASQGQGAEAFQLAEQRRQGFALERGSNAVAIGRERSANGRGMLLANPHFPWSGGMRFYQMHLTIAGKLDVMGAALPGLPVINIGFNRDVAWSHTVDTSKHFTLYRLQLDPADPSRYMLDGVSTSLQRKRLSVTVKGADGQLQEVSRDLYSSAFGPVITWPGRLDWNTQQAFSLRDANLDNDRVLSQWQQMNQATGLDALQASIAKTQGIPWVNTLATDAQGQALFLNQSVVPYVDAQLLAQCAGPQANPAMVVLDGSRSACQWKVDPSAAQPGIFPASRLPQLRRTDFVQNSNDSAWQTNPAQALTSYSPLISQDAIELSPRARFALQRLSQGGKLGVADLQRMVMDNQVYLAELVLPDLLAACSTPAAVEAVCSQLRAWDGKANVDSNLGVLHLNNIMTALKNLPGVWRVPFDAGDPQHTPRGIAIERPEVAQGVRQAMLASQAMSEKNQLTQPHWGDVQVSRIGTHTLPIHGGPASLGVYNAMQSIPSEGHLQVVSGTSYLQVVSFDGHGPQAQGLLAFSQSSDPQSPHASDQTRAFSRKQWQTLPFTEAQITADPQYRVQTISTLGGR